MAGASLFCIFMEKSHLSRCFELTQTNSTFQGKRLRNEICSFG